MESEPDRFTRILDHDTHEYLGAFAVKIAAETGQDLPETMKADAETAIHTLDTWFPILIKRAKSTEFPLGEDALEKTIKALDDIRSTMSSVRLVEMLRVVPPPEWKEEEDRG